jgi:thioredoxin-dependent peroxiredoxin
VLEPGDPAPDFTLSNQHGDEVALASFRGRKVLVYFYPRASTPGCTTQACGLRDALPDLGDTGVVGVSPDPPAALARFDEDHQLGFPLLSDADHAVADAYGAWGEKSMYGRRYHGVIRSAFLVDEEGRLSHVWPRISPKDTPAKLRRAVGA